MREFVISILMALGLIGAQPLGGSTVLMPNQGGTGTSTKPTSGQMLIGNGSGGYNFIASSSLGGVSGGGGSIATGTAAGEVAWFDGSKWTYTSTGTSGQFLKSNGVLVPSWADISSGGLATSSILSLFSASAPISYSTTSNSGSFSLNKLTTFDFSSANISQWTNDSGYISSTYLSANSPITYNSGTGVIGWTNSNNYITLGSLSGDAPISYNSGTGHISFVNPGYISTESDPIWIAASSSYVRWNAPSTTLWDTAYGWGNHASAGYIKIETDPIWTSASKTLSVSNFASANVSQWTNDVGYITSSPSNGKILSGISGQIPYYASNTSTLTATSTLFINNEKVGIGTTTPLARLHVYNGDILAGQPWGTGSGIMNLNPVADDNTIFYWGGYEGAFRAGEWTIIVTSSLIGKDGSTAFGQDTVAQGNSSFAANYKSQASGFSSFAVNESTLASGADSFAAGYKSQATDIGAVSIGYYTKAAQDYSFATGYYSSTTAAEAFASGYYATANGGYSSAFNYHTQANGTASAAFGDYTTADSEDSFVIGAYNIGGGDGINWNLGDPLFEIGNGLNSGSKSDALVVLKNGNTGIRTSSPIYSLSVVGDINATGTYRINDVDYGQYFINSAGNLGQLWSSNGSGRGGWVDTSTLGLAPSSGSSNYVWLQGTTGTQQVGNLNISGNGFVGTKLGIATLNPKVVLQVNNNGTTTLPTIDSGTTLLIDTSGNAADWGSISVLAGKSGIASLYFGDDEGENRGSLRYNNSLDALTIGTNGNGYLTLDNSGKLGIGTTSPAYKLDVYGDINTTGTYRIAGVDYGQYFIDSAGTLGQVWQSNGSGRGGWSSNLTLTSLTSTNANFTLVTGAGNLSTLTTGSATSTNLAITGTTALASLGVATSKFTVDTNGNITKINNVVISFPTTQGFAGQVLRNDGAGILTWVGSVPSTTVAFSVASTSWSVGVTTSILLGYADAAETWLVAGCGTDVGTSSIQFGDGTNKIPAITAAPVVATSTLSTNNTFVALEKYYIDIGNVTGTPNFIACRVQKTK